MAPEKEKKTLDSSSRYTIAWITALMHEAAAALVMLDETHEEPKGFVKAAGDNNAYRWGCVGKHNVVIASLPAGVYGLVSAASTAQGLVSSLPHIRIGLFVGIGGGVPNGDEMLLGDVVVSQPCGTNGGVVQYDLFKVKSERERKGFLNSPPTALLTAVASLQAQHEAEEPEIGRYLKAVEANKRMRKTYSFPGVARDHIRQSTGTDREEPEVHYGTIASGNTLIKSSTKRDELVDWLRHEGVVPLCFEMEAAGLMNSFPCLVIRGICDYADEHKNDVWQKYAAAVAAACAKEFLSFVSTTDVQHTAQLRELADLMRDVQKQQLNINEGISEIRSDLAIQRQDHMDDKLRQWLAAPDAFENHHRALSLRHPGSGSWLSDPGGFFECLDEQRLHWLHGISGCGKTVLAATIIEHLQQHSAVDEVLLYFYFDFQNTQKQTFDKLLRSLVIQAHDSLAASQTPLHALYEASAGGSKQPTNEQLSKVLDEMLEGKQARIVIDALDECTARRPVYAWLNALLTDRSRQLQLIMTSRPEDDISEAITEHSPILTALAIEGHCVNSDITAYIRHRLVTGQISDICQHCPDVTEHIEEVLVAKAGGMFRWAACQLDWLCESRFPEQLERRLATLPKDLHETYTRILDGIPDDLKPYTIRILQFLTYSDHPLTCEEVIEALRTSCEGEPALRSRDKMPRPDRLASIASNLVSYTTIWQLPWDANYQEDIYHEVGALQLAHLSVKEYLVSMHVQHSFAMELTEHVARSTITEVCLNYILAMAQCSTFSVVHDYPLADYCAQSWLKHAVRLSRPAEALRRKMLLLLRDPEAYDHFRHLLYSWDERRADPLCCVAQHGVICAVQDLIDAGVDPDAGRSECLTALCAAAGNGHKQVVKLLLDQGAEIDIQGHYYGNALQVAARSGHARIVRLLLDRSADVNVHGGLYGSALQAACSSQVESLEVVNSLLEAGAEIDAEGGRYGTALLAASSCGNYDTVAALLRAGADANKEAYGMNVFDGPTGPYDIGWLPMNSPLQAASREGHTEIVDLLLGHGAMINVMMDLDGTALQAACSSDTEHIETVRLLLHEGADVHTDGGSRGSAIMGATTMGHLETVKELLEAGARVEAGVIEAAARYGRTQILSELVEADAKPGLIVLEAAAERGHAQIVEQLLKAGVKAGSSMLQTASERGYEQVVQLLQSAGGHRDG